MLKCPKGEEMEGLRAEIKELQEEKQAREAEMAELRKQIDSNKKSIEDLTQGKKESDDRIIQLEETIVEYERQNDVIRKNLEGTGIKLSE